MARTRTTIRRVDPWSILKFAFVANLVLLGIQLLAGAVVWYAIQRLELIDTVCDLAANIGFNECGVDGGALFDTFLVLGLLGVVIQTGILVFLTFLANLIFDLTGGIVLTLEDDRGPVPVQGRGIGARDAGSRRSSGASSRTGRGVTGATAPTVAAGEDRTDSVPTGSQRDQEWPGDRLSRGPAESATGSGPADDDTLFSR